MEPETTKNKTRTSKPLTNPLPDGRVNIERHFAILEYLSRNGNKPLSSKEIANHIEPKIHNTMVGGVFAFFYNIGLLNREKGKYSLKEGLSNVMKNLAWKKEEDAKKQLKDLFLECWFGKLIQEKSKLTPNISKTNLIRDIGLECGADPTYHSKSLLRLMEFIEFANILTYDPDKKIYDFNIGNVNYSESTPVESPKKLVEENPLELEGKENPASINQNQEFYTITIKGFGKTDIYNVEEIDDIEIFEAVINKIKRKLNINKDE